MPDSSPSRRLIVIRMRVFGPKVWLTILEWFVQNNEEDWWRLTRDPRPTRVLLQIFQSRIKMQTEKKLWSTLQTDLISSLNTRRSSHRNNKKSLLQKWMWEVWWFSVALQSGLSAKSLLIGLAMKDGGLGVRAPVQIKISARSDQSISVRNSVKLWQMMLCWHLSHSPM